MFVRLLICLLFIFFLLYCTKSHIFAYSNRQTRTITYIVKNHHQSYFFYEIKINLMFSLLFFSPFAIYITFVKFRLSLSNNRWFYVCIFITVYFFIKKSKLLGFTQYLYIFTFALVLGYIAYLSKQCELVSFYFCLYAFIS